MHWRDGTWLPKVGGPSGHQKKPEVIDEARTKGPTVGAQLDVHLEAVDAMGHWSSGTGMRALYDGMA